MLLEDVRKLKVSELRAELRDRGLDSRGLKAELVVRLLRAIGRTEPEQNQPVAAEQAGDASDTDPPALDEGQQPCPTDPRTVSPAGTDPEPPNFKENPATPPQIHIRPTVDQSTQTETKFCSCLCKWRESEKSPTKSQDVLTGTTNVHDQGVLLTCSPSELTFPAASEPEAPGTCSREPAPPVLTDEESTDAFGSLKRPPCERGRDYYEFKEEIHYLRAKTPDPGPVSEDEMEMEMDDDMVQLDAYNSDVHFEVGADGRSGQPLLWEKFPLLHSGCRLTHGFSRGKVGFEVKFVQCLLSHTEVPSVDPEPHVLRVGWSVDGSSFQLGNDELSFAFDNSGNVVRAGMTEGFADPFAEGDVIGCYASIGEAGEAELSFSINGRYLGVAFHLKPSSLGGRALFPHVLCKNCSVSLNLDPQDKEWHPGPPGFCPLPRLPPSRQTRAPLPPSHRKDCEVLLMVGLPGSGKSHWARSHMTQNPEKRYNMLSTDAVGRCMSLQPPSPAHRETLLQQATQCLTQLLRIAATKRRNFILDQANIYASARRHKMLRFKGYKRRAVVVVPSEEQWKSRLQQRAQNEGAVVPEMSLIKSKVSFTLPEQGDLLEEVLFVELSHGDTQELLRSYKEEAGRLLPAPPPPKRKRQQNRAHGRTQSSSLITPPPQYGRFKPNVPASHQSYGCNSDPQQYRDYYQPCTGQWNMYNPNQSYYGNQNYYYGNQPFC